MKMNTCKFIKCTHLEQDNGAVWGENWFFCDADRLCIANVCMNDSNEIFEPANALNNGINYVEKNIKLPNANVMKI